LSAPEPRDFEIKHTEHANLIERRAPTSVLKSNFGKAFLTMYEQIANFITHYGIKSANKYAICECKMFPMDKSKSRQGLMGLVGHLDVALQIPDGLRQIPSISRFRSRTRDWFSEKWVQRTRQLGARVL
jgi:hypothetical protein